MYDVVVCRIGESQTNDPRLQEDPKTNSAVLRNP